MILLDSGLGGWPVEVEAVEVEVPFLDFLHIHTLLTAQHAKASTPRGQEEIYPSAAASASAQPMTMAIYPARTLTLTSDLKFEVPQVVQVQVQVVWENEAVKLTS